MSDLVKVETTVTISLKGGDYILTSDEAIELRDALNKAFPAYRPSITFPEGVRSPDEDKDTPKPRPRTPRDPVIPIKPFNPKDFPYWPDPQPWKWPNDKSFPNSPGTPTWQPRIFCGTSSELSKSL
jgi:hypothetical protein